MTQQKSATGLDFDVLRRAIEQKDAGLLANLYAEDVELKVINRNTPPSSPFEVRGREAICEYYDDVCGRAMTHRIERVVIGEGRAAFHEECEYPDVTRILCAAMLDFKDGRIARQVNVEVWDE